jgi:hypothetical protein
MPLNICTSGQPNCYCKSGRSRAIVRIDADGNVLEAYCSGSDAARKLGFTPSQLSAALRGRSTKGGGSVNGHYFRFYDVNEPLGRAVELVGDDGVVLQSWPSATVAMRDTGVSNSEIGKVCNAGGGKTRGLYFQYRDRDATTETEESSTAFQNFVPPPPDARDRVSQCYLDTTDGEEKKKIVSMYFESGQWIYNVRPADDPNAPPIRLSVDEVLRVADWDNEGEDTQIHSSSSRSFSTETSAFDNEDNADENTSSTSSYLSNRRGRRAGKYGCRPGRNNDAQEMRRFLKDLNLVHHAPALLREQFTVAVMRQAYSKDEYNRNCWLRDNLIEMGLVETEADAVLSGLGVLEPRVAQMPPPESGPSSMDLSESNVEIDPDPAEKRQKRMELSNSMLVDDESSEEQQTIKADDEDDNGGEGEEKGGDTRTSAVMAMDLSDVPANIEPIMREKTTTPCSSKYKGVTRKGSKWASKLNVSGESYYLGTFNAEYEAALTYARARYKIEEMT